MPVPAENGRPVVLVLRALKLGDLLVAVPALHALRRAYPGHRLFYAAQGWLEDAVALVGGFELLPTHGLDVPIALEPGQVDVAVNLHGLGSGERFPHRSAQAGTGHRACFGAPARPHMEGPHPRARALDAAAPVAWHRGRPRRFQAKPAFHADRPAGRDRDSPRGGLRQPALARGSLRHRWRPNWPAPAMTWFLPAAFGNGPAPCRVAGLAGLGEERVLAGAQSLGSFAALVSESRLLVSADTGAAHLATAYRRPSVVLFGPAPPEEWGPPPGPHAVLTKAGSRRGDTFASDPDPALLGVEVDEVLGAVQRLGHLPTMPSDAPNPIPRGNVFQRHDPWGRS